MLQTMLGEEHEGIGILASLNFSVGAHGLCVNKEINA